MTNTALRNAIATIIDTPILTQTALDALIADIADIDAIISSDAFARMILNDDDIDYIDACDAIFLITNDSPAFRDFCAMTDICPIHRIALEICADDENAECAHLR